MAPDERESLTTGQRSLNAKNEKPFHVSEHQPHVMNISWPTLGIQYAKLVEVIAPAIPNLYFIVVSQERNTWMIIEKAAKNAMMTFLLWDCRNVWQVNEAMKANMIGIDQREMLPATCAMFSSWPKRDKIGVVKKNTGRRKNAVTVKTIHDLWRYTPIMPYSFAPYAWPQSVDKALAIPNCSRQFRSTNSFGYHDRILFWLQLHTTLLGQYNNSIEQIIDVSINSETKIQTWKLRQTPKACDSLWYQMFTSFNLWSICFPEILTTPVF